MFYKTQGFNKIRLLSKSFAILLTGLISALMSIWLFGPSVIDVEGISIKVAIAPSTASITELRLPPFGVIESRTHQGPVKLSLTLEQINSDSLKTHINNPPDSQEFLQRIRKGIENSVLAFAWRQVIIAFIAAFLMILVVWRTSITKALLNALIGIILLSITIIYSANTYNPQAFAEAEYKGVISMAPSVMEFASTSFSNLESIKKDTEKIVSNLRKIFTSADSLMIMANPEDQDQVVKILLISDLHSNPVGIEFTKSLADNFQIDFIINSGDLTDFGTVAEAEAIKDLQTIKTTQLFAAGNHDSPEIMDIVSGYDNFRILDGQMVSVSGLRILGFPDPLVSVADVKYASEEEERRLMEEQADIIKSAIEIQGQPDILIVHNSQLGRKLMYLSRLTVSGHDHQANMVQQGNSIFINPGTSGAAGLRGLYSEEGKTYSAAIAYIAPQSGLLAIDFIDYSPVSKQFSLQRKLVDVSPDSQAKP